MYNDIIHPLEQMVGSAPSYFPSEDLQVMVVVRIRVKVRVGVSVNKVRVRVRVWVWVRVSVNRVRVQMGIEKRLSCIFVHLRRKITLS